MALSENIADIYPLYKQQVGKRLLTENNVVVSLSQIVTVGEVVHEPDDSLDRQTKLTRECN